MEGDPEISGEPHHEAHVRHEAPTHHPSHAASGNQTPWMIVSIFFAILLVIVLGMYIMLAKSVITSGVAAPTAPAAPAAAAPTPTPAAAPTPAAPVDITLTTADHIKGTKGAKVVMVEYSDFQCPFCGRAEPTVEQVLKDYAGKIEFVYRHFPLSFHENARPAALASECANEQGKFWEYHDTLYANQGAETAADLVKYATDLKLDMTKFNDCVKTEKYASVVDGDEAQGGQYGVQGTPAFFINGKLLSGAQPYSAFKQMIDAALA